jgi:hypothetical protein
MCLSTLSVCTGSNCEILWLIVMSQVGCGNPPLFGS